MASFWLRLLVGVSALLWLGGCGCDVGADPDGPKNAAGVVRADGSVQFTSIPHGTTETFPIPVKESADTTETIRSASIVGSGAASFEVLSPMPIEVPNGRDVLVEVQFAPASAGTFQAELMLETAKMGTSQISLVGAGL